MTNHPRRASRLARKDQRRLARRVAVWVDRYTDAALTPWQRDLLGRAATSWRDRSHPSRTGVPVAIGVDIARDGDDTVTVATMTAGGQVFVAPLGTPPPGRARWDTVDAASIMADIRDGVRALATVTATPAVTWPAVIRGLEDNVTGREWPDDGLHPASLLGWSQTVEGLDADLMPLVVCDHCGEPVPCIEKVLRHMDTDGHRCFCRPTGTCTVTGRPVSELPTR